MNQRKKEMNRKQIRKINYTKPTNFMVIATEQGKAIAYIHPTKGYRGRKSAILQYRAAMGYK